MSRSPGRFTHRGLNAWGRRSGDRDNVLGVGNYTATLRLLGGARGAWAPTGRRGAGAHRVATRTACLRFTSNFYFCLCVIIHFELVIRMPCSPDPSAYGTARVQIWPIYWYFRCITENRHQSTIRYDTIRLFQAACAEHKVHKTKRRKEKKNTKNKHNIKT